MLTHLLISVIEICPERLFEIKLIAKQKQEKNKNTGVVKTRKGAAAKMVSASTGENPKGRGSKSGKNTSIVKTRKRAMAKMVKGRHR